MSEIRNLEPKAVWGYFDDICAIPHPSYKEERISKYIAEFGRSLGLETLTDEYGNILIRKPAAAGLEDKPSLLLQSHIDMVCEKNSDVEFDFDNDAIQPYEDGEWVKAKGTTLGADDGIGVAYQMAVLADKELKAGQIECLFTVNEEVGLTGAHVLRTDWIKSGMLVNLDSEEQGEFCIGCAGGVGTFAEYDVKWEKTKEGLFFMSVKVSGLIGGHSGSDINKNRGNALKILAEFLKGVEEISPVWIANIDGGNLHNAIPREASAVFAVETKAKEAVRAKANIMQSEVEAKCECDEHPYIALESTDAVERVMTERMSRDIIEALSLCPHGVEKMSEDMAGLVQTSTNLASIKMKEDGRVIVIETSQRSSDEEEKEEIRRKVMTAFVKAGAQRVYSDEGYCGWKPNIHSRIKDISAEEYKRLFGVEPNIGAIHAGLECGLIKEKYPELDMISFGPTIIGNHSPAERVNIKTVDMTWKHLIAVIERVAKDGKE